MALDTKYRPKSFDDVLGQEATVQILRHFIATGTGFAQSYLFAGLYGSGKTTLARILARGLLCEAPTPEGNPCDKCLSCQDMLTKGVADGFVEFDAGTNSGKDDIRRIVEESEYASFSGKQRIYLIDESHQLSQQALDGLLKPMEETIPGSENKKLVCIFCTTEPENMRETVASRCAPIFKIRPTPPAVIADRLALVCQQEGIPFDLDTLKLIAEYAECHIRDCLKAVEGISLLGGVTAKNAAAYLGLGRNTKYLDILFAVDSDLAKALDLIWSLQHEMPPAIVYQKLSEAAILAFRLSLGPTEVPSFWDKTRLAQLGAQLQFRLLEFVQTFSLRPTKPTFSMIACDAALLHHRVPQGTVVLTQTSSQSATPSVQFENLVGKVEVAQHNPRQKADVVVRQGGGLHVDPRAVGASTRPVPSAMTNAFIGPDTLSPGQFTSLLRALMTEQLSGQAGRANMGDD